MATRPFCPEKHEALLKLGCRLSELGLWSAVVAGGRDCLWRDLRQLGRVAGGSTRRAVETLDRTTRKEIVRFERFNDLGSEFVRSLISLSPLQNIWKWWDEIEVEPCGYKDT